MSKCIGSKVHCVMSGCRVNTLIWLLRVGGHCRVVRKVQIGKIEAYIILVFLSWKWHSK